MLKEFLVVIKYTTGQVDYSTFLTCEAAAQYYVLNRRGEHVEWAEFLRTTAEGMMRLTFFVPAPVFNADRPVTPLVAAFRRARLEAANRAESI